MGLAVSVVSNQHWCCRKEFVVSDEDPGNVGRTIDDGPKNIRRIDGERKYRRSCSYDASLITCRTSLFPSSEDSTARHS